ncbi:hypothetical protein ACFPPE_17050 [Agromyces tardus]|uniref:hypothetical protein n=1 Tax=Agromyces tardus TaxID=2583849 RepID=UPI001BAEFED7|nr:hypothetical protein [Agromyces tardus]
MSVSTEVRATAQDVDTRLTVRAVTWHRPLAVLVLLMVALTAASVAGLLLDERELLGQPIWAKPLKFSVSILIYSVTFSWLIGLTRGRLRRVAWWAGTIAAAALLVEMAVIVGAVVAGTTSHFNVSTPLNTTLWAVMAASIVVVWVASLLVSLALFRAPLGDRARTLAIRAGALVALLGMGLAFLMTGPTAAQLQDFRGVAGAHSVGVADGGAGIPILGWSTEGGDLRIPHFIGMHALQLLPLAAILLELAARRIPQLRRPATRLGVMRVLVAVYLGTVAIVTFQALAGESIVAPGGATIVASLTLWAAALLAVAVTLGVASRSEAPSQVGDSAASVAR